MNGTTSTAHFSLPSLIAIAAAIGSFAAGAFWGFVLAMIAIFFGIMGVVIAFSPRVRGGIVSIFSMLAGAVGIIVAVIKAIAPHL